MAAASDVECCAPASAVDETVPSALAHSVATKGQNSYYFAHKNNLGKYKDSNISYDHEPRLLETVHAIAPPATGPRPILISKYAWADGSKIVSIYVDFPGVATLPDDAVTVSTDTTSMQLRISSADGKSVSVLKLSPLSEEVEGATLRRKADQVVVKLQKKVALPWDALLKGPEASTFDYDA